MELDFNIDSNGNVIVNTLSENMLHIFLSCKLPMKVAMSDSFSGANPIKIGMCAHVYLERII